MPPGAKVSQGGDNGGGGRGVVDVLALEVRAPPHGGQCVHGSLRCVTQATQCEFVHRLRVCEHLAYVVLESGQRSTDGLGRGCEPLPGVTEGTEGDYTRRVGDCD